MNLLMPPKTSSKQACRKSDNCDSQKLHAKMDKFTAFLNVGVMCLAVFATGCWSLKMDSNSSVNSSNMEFHKEMACMKNDSSLFHVLHGNESIHMGMDEAFLNITSHIKDTVEICVQYTVCHDCALLHLTSLHAHDQKYVLMSSNFPFVYKVVLKNNISDIICLDTIKLDEHGKYSLYINPEVVNKSNCNFVVDSQTSDFRIPIYVAIAVFVGAAALFLLGKFLYRRGCCGRIAIGNQSERLVNSDLGSTGPDLSGEELAAEQTRMLITPVRRRLGSLDTFRGLSLIIMIFVNYGGGGYWFFHHSAWDGLTVADLVFPWFVFIMGTSIAIAFQSQLKRGLSRKKLLLKVCRRTLILFALGLFVSNRAKKGREVFLGTLRIPGVLQRLAFTYFAVAMMEVAFAKIIERQQFHSKWWSGISDIVLFWPEWLVAAGLLTTQLCVTYLLPIPGCPLGYTGPGGLHDNATHVNCTGGAAGYIDRWLFSDSHMYRHPTTTVPYLTQVPYDPEGVLGSLTSITLCFLGLHAGKILLLHEDWRRRAPRWAGWCLLTGVAAGILCDFRQYGGWIPLNKNLWSLSFILATASMGFLLLTACYFLVDVWQVWSGAPFIYPGTNSIVIYLGHEILSIYFPVQFKVGLNHAAQLAMALWGATFWTIVAGVLHANNISIAV